MHFKTHPEILNMAHMIMTMTGNIPDPRYIITLDTDYVNDLFKWDQGQRYYDDYPKRKPGLR